ncbi:MAG: TonB family protein [Acidobacteriaceae bacterium]|nr:TonB family protein [Acidobacteriaceae bacterium]
MLHLLLAGAVVATAWIHFSGTEWGNQGANAGAIQATMVSSLPLPNRQRDSDTGVLTSDAPSAAPVTAKEKTEVPAPDAVPIPEKITKPVKTAEKSQPAPPKHPQPVPQQPTKAQTGETAGIRIPQSTLDMRNGSASATVQDSNFGARYAYYVNIVNQKVARNWFTKEADQQASIGRSVSVVIDIDRDGKPSNPRVLKKSGSPTLDLSAIRAVERVQDEGFGPLPAGNHITVELTFHYTQP